MCLIMGGIRRSDNTQRKAVVANLFMDFHNLVLCYYGDLESFLLKFDCFKKRS